MSTETNEQHLLRLFDTCIAQAKAPLTAQIEKLTKENDRLTALVSEQYQTQAKIRAALSPVDFRLLMQKIQTSTNAGALTDDQVVATLAAVGLKPEEMAQLIGNAVLIAGVDAGIDKALAGNWVGPPTHKGISIDAYFKQGWSIEQLRKDGYQGPDVAPSTAPKKPVEHAACGYCGEQFEMIPQQVRHVRLGHKVYCDKHHYGQGRES